jgi:hypothetical protein
MTKEDMKCSRCKSLIEKSNLTRINKFPYCKPCGKIRRRNIARLRRQAIVGAYKDLGLVKVRGANGVVYYE